MSVQITDFRLEERGHPSLFMNWQELRRIRELVRHKGTYQHKRFAEIKGVAGGWTAKSSEVPDRRRKVQ